LFMTRPLVVLIYIQSAAVGLIMYLALYGLPQWMQGVKGFSPSQTGLLLVPLSAAAALSSLFVSKWAGPLLTQWLALASAVVGSLALFLLHAESSMGVLIGVFVLVGMATGFNPIANQASLNDETPQELSGVAFGFFRTFVYLG